MASTYQLHSLAKKELTEAVDWYKEERKGRGAKFFIAYLKTLRAILSNPTAFPKDFDEVRKANLQKFPYTIYFEEVGMRSLSIPFFTISETLMFGRSGQADALYFRF